MGGFFGVASKNDCMVDVFFGTDYHSHLGTRRGGMAAYDEEVGLQRQIHNIENSPFRTRFENVFDEMKFRLSLVAKMYALTDDDLQLLNQTINAIANNSDTALSDPLDSLAEYVSMQQGSKSKLNIFGFIFFTCASVGCITKIIDVLADFNFLIKCLRALE